MSALDGAIDGVLAAALPLLAWRVLVTGSLPRAVVLFTALGLLSAVGWARLGAPDIALVEAAVGAGLTGALLMSALGWVGPSEPPGPRPGLVQGALLWLLLGGVVATLDSVVLALPPQSEGLRGEVLEHLDSSGVPHPVTAVLLNFRGYDTLLEMAVLVVAALGAQAHAERPAQLAERDSGPLLPMLIRMLVPGIILVAGYLLWRGASAPGGAFQAGALLGGGAILLMLGRVLRPPRLDSFPVRCALLGGPVLFLLVAAAPLGWGGALLEYPLRWAGALIFALEAALTLSIATVLTLFFPSEEPG